MSGSEQLAGPTIRLEALKDADFKVEEEQQVYQRYLTLYQRKISCPAIGSKKAAVHEYDVIGHPRNDFHFTTVFAFHFNGEVTVLREHCQGPNKMMHVLPTGGFDAKKHNSRLECAQAELLEEAGLFDGEWIKLIPADHQGIPEVKWCANSFTPYLCIDPKISDRKVNQDEEEYIEHRRISIAELLMLLTSGDMMLPSITTCFLAMMRLRELKLLD